MNLKFWQSKHVDLSVPDEVRAAVESQFHPDAATVSRLQCVQRVKNSSGKSVRYIRVFDPTLIEGGSKPIRAYDDLNRHKRAIQFEGHINEKAGNLYIADRRPMNKRTPHTPDAAAAPAVNGSRALPEIPTQANVSRPAAQAKSQRRIES